MQLHPVRNQLGWEKTITRSDTNIHHFQGRGTKNHTLSSSKSLYRPYRRVALVLMIKHPDKARKKVYFLNSLKLVGCVVVQLYP